MLTTILGIGAAVLGLGGLIAGAVYYLHKAVSNAVSIDQLNAQAKMEADRAAANDKAAAEARAARISEVNATVLKVTTANDAAELLRKATDADNSSLN